MQHVKLKKTLGFSGFVFWFFFGVCSLKGNIKQVSFKKEKKGEIEIPIIFPSDMLTILMTQQLGLIVPVRTEESR